ncbi:MAG: type IV pilus modification protein PilV [Steroidobacteraceae bacterium]
MSTPLRKNARGNARGFSLIEVMVALIVIAVGLLGIGKMQALALASTSSASMRSLAALEAASLAATMHSNRDFWSETPPASTTVSGATIASSTAGFPGAVPVPCSTPGSSSCTPTELAADDLQQWVTALNQILPNVTATVLCANGTPPTACTIQIGWSENAVAINSQEAANVTSNETFQTPTYTLYVEP